MHITKSTSLLQSQLAFWKLQLTSDSNNGEQILLKPYFKFMKRNKQLLYCLIFVYYNIIFYSVNKLHQQTLNLLIIRDLRTDQKENWEETTKFWKSRLILIPYYHCLKLSANCKLKQKLPHLAIPAEPCPCQSGPWELILIYHYTKKK